MSYNPKSPTTIVADYIFSSDHDDSDVSWLFRKLDRYNNDSSYTSDACGSPCDLNDTPTSKLVPQSVHAEIGEGATPNCKKKLDLEITQVSMQKGTKLCFSSV